MFRGLFGKKSDRPAPPKNQIEVVCPACGAAQYEPRLVVSTFCKKCGVHLTVERKKVTASSVTRAGTRPPTRPLEPEPSGPSIPEKAPAPATAPKSNGSPAAAELTQAATAEEMAEGGFGAFLKQQSSPPTPPEPPVASPPAPSPAASTAEAEPAPAPEAPPTPPEAAAAPESEPEKKESTGPSPLAKLVQASPPPPAAQDNPEPPQTPAADKPEPPQDLFGSSINQPPAERRPQSNSPPPTAAPAPMSAGTLQKMKDQGLYRNQYFKDAECFECPHKFKVSRSSRSATCPQCGATIPMEDIEINMPSNQKVKTRGDLLIRKRGHLVTEKIICKDLRCYGTLEADVEASGDAIFRSTGTVVGQVRCKRLIIEKGCDVIFQTPVQAEEIEVHARVTGSLISSGPILIGGNGCANGDVTARSVSIEPGGELNGAMNIVRGKAKAKPAPAQEELSLQPSE